MLESLKYSCKLRIRIFKNICERLLLISLRYSAIGQRSYDFCWGYSQPRKFGCMPSENMNSYLNQKANPVNIAVRKFMFIYSELSQVNLKM